MSPRRREDSRRRTEYPVLKVTIVKDVDERRNEILIEGAKHSNRKHTVDGGFTFAGNL